MAKNIPSETTEAYEGRSEPRPPSRDELNRYQDFEKIGRGGMGDVFAAWDPLIGRQVAIKVLREDRRSDPETESKFVREAKITGRLVHPNIVPVYELHFENASRDYFAMKLVRGRTLEQALESQRDPILRRRFDDVWGSYTLSRRLADFLKVLNAVEFAHSQGVIHRDLKPSNIMLAKYGEVLVLDWGLAKTRGQKRERPSGRGDVPTQSGDENATADGAIVGTICYMPPEQALGRIHEIDERSDIYSLGATLYEILTEKPPFRNLARKRLLRAVTEGRLIRPIDRTPERHIPRELEAIVLRAMARQPGQRYQTVRQMKRDLEAFLEGRTVRAARYGVLEIVWKSLVRYRAISLTFAVSLVLLLSMSLLFWRILSRQDMEAKEQEAAIRRLTAVNDSLTSEKGRLGSHYARLRQQRQRSNQQAASYDLELLFESWPQVALFAEKQRREDPGNPNWRFYLGLALLRLDRPEEAMEALQEALQLDPGYSQARLILAQAYEAKGEYGQALAEYDRLLAAREGMALLYLHRGLLHQKIGTEEHLRQSLEDFEQAIEGGIRDRQTLQARDLSRFRLQSFESKD